MDSSPDNSFEVMDPHDPTLSRMATMMCRKTNEYLQAEIANGRDHHLLLEEINRMVIPKYTDLKNLTENLNRTLGTYNTLYMDKIQPLLTEIDALHTVISKIEENAYRLDGYTKQLKMRAKDMNDAK